MTLALRIKLTASEAEKLARPVNGTGGFQDLLRYWKRHKIGALTIEVKGKWIERSIRYRNYGFGGFETRLGA